MNHLTFEEAHETVMGTIRLMASKYSLMHHLSDYDELLSLGAITVWKRLPDWDPNKSKWNTFFMMHFRAACQAYLRTLPTVSCRDVYSLNVPATASEGENVEIVDVLQDESAANDRQETIDHLRKWLSMLSADERAVLQARYLSDAQPTLQQVADQLGMDAKTVTELERGAINQLRTSFGVTYQPTMPQTAVIATLPVGKRTMLFALDGSLRKTVQKVRQRIPGSHFTVRVACHGEGAVRGYNNRRHFYVSRTA